MKKFLLVLSFVALIALISAKRRPLLCGCAPGYPAVCDTNGKKWRNLCELNCANHEEVVHDPEGKCLKQEAKVASIKPKVPPVLCGCAPGYPEVCDTNGKKWRNLCELNCRNHEPVEHDPEGKCLQAV